MLVGLNNCKHSVLQSFYSAPCLFNNPDRVYEKLEAKNAELIKIVEYIESDMKWKLTDVNEIQKSLLATMTNLERFAPPRQPLQEVNPLQERKNSQNQATEEPKSNDITTPVKVKEQDQCYTTPLKAKEDNQVTEESKAKEGDELTEESKAKEGDEVTEEAKAKDGDEVTEEAKAKEGDEETEEAKAKEGDEETEEVKAKEGDKTKSPSPVKDKTKSPTPVRDKQTEEETTEKSEEEQKQPETDDNDKENQEQLRKPSEEEPKKSDLEKPIDEKRPVALIPLDPQAAILELEKSEKLSNLQIEVNLYNDKIANLSTSFTNYVKDINVDRQNLIDYFIKSIFEFKSEEAKIYETMFNNQSNILNKDNAIAVPILSEETLLEAIPDYLQADSCVNFLQDIVEQRASNGYFEDEMQSPFKNQANQVKTGFAEGIKSGWGDFIGLFKKSDVYIDDAMVNSPQKLQQNMPKILTQPQMLFGFLDTVMIDGHMGSEGVQMFNDVTKDERARRDVIAHINNMHFEKTLKDECYFALHSISMMFLRTCLAEQDWLNAVLYILAVQGFRYVCRVEDGNVTNMVDDLMNDPILDNINFWISFNTHLFKLASHFSLQKGETVDVKKLLTTECFGKNMTLLKRKVLDVNTFTEIMDGVIAKLCILEDSNTELVEEIRTICLVIFFLVNKNRRVMRMMIN